MEKADRICLEKITVEDVRFRFHEGGPGSDAINPHTDYSNPYITVRTNVAGLEGTGIGFTLGRGNDLVCTAARRLKPLIEGKMLSELLEDFAAYWRKLANPLQARWLGPGCGTYYMAAGALINAVFDLWAKAEEKPLWELLSDCAPELIVSMLDFRYVEHLIDRTDALSILRENRGGIENRKKLLHEKGLPCYYTTWIGTTTASLIEQIEEVRQRDGIDTFKVKVGVSLEQDRSRLSALRERFGDNISLLADANQVWSVPQAIDWMKALAEYDVGWIEEPVAPDLIDGHRLIREELKSFGIEVVSGENCPNSHVAGQFMASKAIDRFQPDTCRVLGPPEILLILLLAQKYGVPACPHAGGSGLDELVPHLSAWNFLCCRPTLERTLVEHVGFCSRFFVAPSRVSAGRLTVPEQPGYLVGMRRDAIREYRFPDGPAWHGLSSIENGDEG
jgi:L-fuconate dehydratase